MSTTTLTLPRAIPEGTIHLLTYRSGTPCIVQRDGDWSGPRSFDRAAILEAIETLAIDGPVKIRLTNGRRRAGTHKVRDGVHCITLSKGFSAVVMSRNLWHELTHAKQCETAGGWSEFVRKYMTNHRLLGYKRNPFEIEAREAEAWHEACPLVTEV